MTRLSPSMLVRGNKLPVKLEANTIPGLEAMRPAETPHHADHAQLNQPAILKSIDGSNMGQNVAMST
jgi:hypothetical protein